MKTAADHFPHNQISVPPSCIPMVAPCVRESSVKKKTVNKPYSVQEPDSDSVLPH